jgi:cell division protein ZapA
MNGQPSPVADGQVTLDVSLLGRSYKFACRESERAALLDAVAFLDRRMRDIRDAGKVAGAERIAIMAALNIAHDLRAAGGEPPATTSAGDSARPVPPPFDDTDAQRRIDAMCADVDEALADDRGST